MTTNVIQKIDENSQQIETTHYSVNQLTEQVYAIQQMMKNLMKKDIHYGCIPGCGGKPSLLKPGAEKLCLMFRLAPTYKIKCIKEFQNSHREYEIVCTLTHIQTGQLQGEGVGAATTLENRYRYRWENTGRPIPSEYWKTKDPQLLGGSQYVPRKGAGNWSIFERIEHDNPADYYNTILKMAKKRAHVDACLTVTAASDIFNQDLEDLVANEIIVTKIDEFTVEESSSNDEAEFGDYLSKMDLSQNKSELLSLYNMAFEKAKEQKNGQMMAKLANLKNKKSQEFNGNKENEKKNN